MIELGGDPGPPAGVVSVVDRADPGGEARVGVDAGGSFVGGVDPRVERRPGDIDDLEQPLHLTLVRSAALQVPALVSILHHSMLAEHERPAGAWHSEWQPLRDCPVLVGAAAATTTELLDGLVVDTAQMRRNLDLTAGQIVSERLSTAPTPLLGKIAAKNVLRTAAFEAERTRRPMVDILTENSDVRAHFDHDAIAALLLPVTGIAVAVPAAAIVVMMLVGGGQHGPGRHMPGGGSPGSSHVPLSGHAPGAGGPHSQAVTATPSSTP
ncbi:lyase family protein [Nocardia bovistercoris]|uniref:Uncharacterized protein n=1 Tax=Nocardia bovistercoris TaxID=2785916 RepID=A0A931IGE7_9NOCA|nr:hypothetical protein [Nocardia bovistercoris]MBH0779926.1 hypothetical protein [Nocardia bovistercoris]